MRKHRLILFAITLAVSGNLQGARARQDPERPVVTIKDIMSSQLDPSAQYIWNSVAIEISKAGVRTRAPETDKDWEELGKRITTLLDATNQLVVPGRPVATAGDKPQNPEELLPEEIEKLINADRTTWIALVRGLYEASQRTQKAIGARDSRTLMATGGEIYQACENCHMKYWYPKGRPVKPR